MIFNEKRNNVLEIMMEIDEEFKAEYIKFAENLPQKIRNRCASCRSFETEYDDVSYELGIYRDDENAAELSVDNWLYEEKSYLLYVCELKEKSLKKLDYYEEDSLVHEVYEFGAFTITGDEEIDYNFEIRSDMGYVKEVIREIRKIDDDKFVVVASKEIQKEATSAISNVVRTIEKEFTYNELVSRLNGLKPRR